MILIFVSDLANLINDSRSWSNEPNENGILTNSLLKIYKFSQIILFSIVVLSIIFAIRRPKFSRFIIIIGLVFCLLIHLNLFQMKSEEKYILEVFVSFSLMSYLTMARTYNIMQFIRYMKGE